MVNLRLLNKLERGPNNEYVIVGAGNFADEMAAVTINYYFVECAI